MEDFGLIWQQDVFLTASIVFLITGGIFLLIGYRSKFASLLLLIYWLPLTFTLHSFWNDPKEIQRLQSVLFMKDIAIAGGLLMVMVNGSGKYSIRRLLSWRRRIKLKDKT
jgi:putative oxidoreductase